MTIRLRRAVEDKIDKVLKDAREDIAEALASQYPLSNHSIKGSLTLDVKILGEVNTEGVADRIGSLFASVGVVAPMSSKSS